MTLAKAENLKTEGVVELAPVVGKIIKRHRIWKDLNRKQLGEMASIGSGYIAKIEQGIYDPSIKTLAKIAKALEVPLWQLIKEAEELAEQEGNNENS